MGISVNSVPVNRGKTDPSQNKASKAKSKADKDKIIQSKKESSQAKTDSKDHQKLLKSLYVSHAETIKNFGLAGKSLLGSMPVLSQWKEETDTTNAKSSKDDSNASSAKDEPQSTNKLSSKTLSGNVATSSRKNLEEQSSTSSKVAQNQSNTNTNKNDKASTATKGAHGKAINSEAKISKASSGAIRTQQEMDGFIDVLMQGVKKFQAKTGTRASKSLNTKDILKGKNKDGKSASSTSLFNDDNSSLANNPEPKAANKLNSNKMSAFNKLHQTKGKKFSSYGSEISDDQTSSKDNTSHLDKNIPEHILNARKHSMALKGSINNIANNASLQSLINRYLDTRGSYSIKIMIEMEKLKKGKGKTTTAELSDAQKSRGLASDRQISEMKKVNKKQEEAKKVQKAMGILGIIMAVVALLVSFAAIVGSAGTLGPVLIFAIVGVMVAITALGISAGDTSTTTVDGRTMGRFDACIYKSYRSEGVSQQQALKDTKYTTMGIQAGLVLITLGTSIGTAAAASEGIIKLVDAITNKIASWSNKLAFAVDGGTRFAQYLSDIAESSAAESELNASLSKQTLQLLQGILSATQVGLMGYKTDLDYKTTTLQAKVTEIQAIFENIEQHEHVAQTLMQKSIKRISEATGSVMKTLDAEYQAIKLLNMRSKVA